MFHASCFMNKGFTMIELIVVMSIVGILSSALFFNWRSGEATFALQNSAYKLAQNIREMQEMAMEAREIDCNGYTGSSFGVQFKRSWPTYYKLFVDCNDNKVFDANDKTLGIVNFEKGVEISTLSAPALSPAAAFDVLFVPPDPTTYIKNKTSDMEGVVTIYLPDYPSKQKIITINTSGMIKIK